MFVPKFNFLIICENMKKSLNNKNHFPSFHLCLIVIISLGATLWQFCCCPLGMAACRCLFSLGKTIIIVPEKEKVFLDMLCRGRSTGKKKIFSSWAGIELFLKNCLFYLNWWKGTSWTPDSYMCMKSFLPGTTESDFLLRAQRERVLVCMLDILL